MSKPQVWPRSRIVVDSREQKPWPIPTERQVVKALPYGDYTLEDYPHIVCVERKSLDDLVGSMIPTKRDNAGPNARDRRQRFKDELQVMGEVVDNPFLIVEAQWSDISKKNYTSNIHPRAVMGALVRWQQRYRVGVILAGDRAHAMAIMLWHMRAAEDTFHAGQGDRERDRRS